MMASNNRRPAGMSDDDDFWNEISQPTEPKVSTMNSKKRKAQKYWEEQKKMRVSIGTVPRPQDCPTNANYFSHHKQLNMGLMSITPTPFAAILSWEPRRELFDPYNGSCKDIHSKHVRLIYVDTEDSLMEMICKLNKSEEFAIDIECNMENSFLGMTCLMQISTWHYDYIIDPFPIFEQVKRELAPIFKDGNVLKILYGASSLDIVALRRDFGFVIVGAIDVQETFKAWDNSCGNVGFKEAVKKILKFDVDKTFQNFDWRKRPLLDVMINYARDDSHLLLRLWNCVRVQILDSLGKNGLIKAFNRTSSSVLLKEYIKPDPITACQELRRQKNTPNFAPSDLLAFELLYEWRNRYAKIVDSRPSELLSTAVLIKLAGVASTIKSPEDVVKVVGVYDKKSRKYEMPKLVHSQENTIFRFLTEKSSFISRLASMTCHNCLLLGHAAVHCPFPSNKNRLKQYMQLHPNHKRERNKLRKQKYLIRKREKLLNLDKNVTQ